MTNGDNKTTCIKKVKVNYCNALREDSKKFWLSLNFKDSLFSSCEFHEVEIDPEKSIELFGMHIPVSILRIMEADIWDCNFIERGGASIFTINGIQIAADINTLDLFIGSELLHQDIQAIACRSGDASVLSNFTQLIAVQWHWCASLTDIRPLAGLTNLTTLDLTGCDSLTDLTGLSMLTNLTTLDLTACNSLTDLTALSGLTNLKHLDLEECESLSDLSGLSGLTNLKTLDLSWCESLTDITHLSELRNLTSLTLSASDKISTISSLTGMPELSRLGLKFLNRLDADETLATLLTLPKLCQICHSLHPGDIASVLANAAAVRQDCEYIDENADSWLGEAKAFTDVSLTRRERLAAALGSAFAMLHPTNGIVERFEKYLSGCQDYSAIPWKTWFQGNKDNWGFDICRMRVERFPIDSMSFGAVGGACSIMPVEASPEPERKWAVDWLIDLDDAFGSRSHDLKPVMAEVCLAYARLGDKSGLESWLDRFAASSDPSALDPVQEALGRWCLGRDEHESALRHAAVIASDRVRDSLLYDIARAAIGNPAKAVNVLGLIDTTQFRHKLALELAGNPLVANMPEILASVVGAAADSPSVLARMVEYVGAFESASDLLNQLSHQFASDADSYKEWRKNQIRKLLETI